MLKRPSHRCAYLGVAVVLALVAGVVWWLELRPGQQGDLAWARLQAEGDIRVGLDPSYPPFEFEDEGSGQIMGYDVDLAKGIASRLGVTATFVHVGFDSLYDTLRSGKVDAVISGMPYDPNMTEDYSYGIWYFNAGQYLSVRSDSTAIGGPGDIGGKRVAVELGSTGDLEARRMQQRVQGMTVLPYRSAEEALQAVLDSKADAALVDAISQYLFIGHGHPLHLIGDPVLDESYAVVTARQSRLLRAAIDQAILAMKADGFLDTLRARWLLGKTA